MKASLHYVVRNLGRRRTRTVLGVLGVFCTLALLTAIQIGLESVSSSYLDLAALQAGKADLVIAAEGGSFLRPESFPEAEVRQKLAGHPVLQGLAPRLLGVVQVGAEGSGPVAVLLGIDAAMERELDLSGLVPDPTLRAGSCAVSRPLARKLGWKPGDVAVLRSAKTGEEVALKLGELIDRQLILPQEVKDFIVVDTAMARVLLDEPALVHALAGALRRPAQYYDARDLQRSGRRIKDAGEAIAAALGPGYEVRLPKAAAVATLQNFTAPVRAFFGVFAVLALSITALLVYAIVSVAVEERIREYAILRTLGGKRRDIIGLVLGESLLLCLAGVVPGLLAGVGLARVGVKIVGRIMRAEGDPIALLVSPGTLGLTLAAGVFLSLGAALLPALQAVRWRIVDGLDPFRRGQIAPDAGGEGAPNRSLLGTGLALSALSVVVFFVLPTAFLSGDPSLIGTVILCLVLTILIGFTLVAVGTLPWVERAVLAAVGWTLGPVAEMAGRNLGRYRRRNTTTAVMFILSVSWVVYVASIAALFSRTSLALVEHFNGADIRLQGDTALASKVGADLAALEGVAAVAEARSLRSRTQAGIAYDVVMSDLVGLKQLWVVPFGVDARIADVLYLDRIKYEEGGPEVWARWQRVARPPAPRPPVGDDRGPVVIESETPPLPAGPASAVAGDGADEIFPVILSWSAARFLEVQAGDVVRLSFRLGAARRERRCRVEAICSAVPGFENFRSRVAQAVGSGVLLPLAAFEQMTQAAPSEAFQSRFFIKTSQGDDGAKAVAQRIRDEFDVRYRFGVKSTVERKAETKKLYWVTQVLFGLLLAVAIVIAVFALIASMATAVIERRWEVGVLKALGLRRAQLFRMFLGEAVVLTLAAGLVGGAIGFSLAYLFVVQAAALMEVPVTFALPYFTFAATFALSLGAGALAAHLPTRRLLRRPAAEILRADG